MSDYLKLKKSNCKSCYKCIRHCPVKSIRFSDNQAHIIPEDCILCGNCFVVCPQNAKEIRQDLHVARDLIQSEAPVYASLAPSFVANYERATIGSMSQALKQLGFAGVEETAIGATVVKDQYDRLVSAGDQDVILSSCCHTINRMIQKYDPDLLPCLASVVSPMQAHARDIRRRCPEARIVFIGPCISKKAEAAEYPGLIDCVLTFEELTLWLKEEQIAIEPAEPKLEIGRTRLFPISGGILRTMKADNPEWTYLAIDGMDKCLRAIQDIRAGRLKKCFIEMSACEGSCVGGPAMDRDRRSPVLDTVAVTRQAGCNDFTVEALAQAVLRKEFPSLAIRKVKFGEKAIADILKNMGKTRADQELNCGSCGYDTCRDKAAAVLAGKADLSMCLPFLKDKAESFSDNIIQNTPNSIIVLNENFEVQQINAAACRLMNLRSPQDILGDQVVRILDPSPFFEVRQKSRNIYDRRTYLAEYDRHVVQTVLYDRSYHIIICIMRDITEEARQQDSREQFRRTTIEITDKVIEKQMRAVQEIASLLGETTAETKVALTRLKESLNHE